MKRRSKVAPRPAVPIGLPHRHALLGPAVADVFRELEISAALTDGGLWYPLNVVRSVASFELDHGREQPRERYNRQSLKRVLRDGAVLVGEHAGFHDVFSPICDGDRVWGALVAGPLATTRATSSELRERWRWLTGTHGRMSDPAFAHYAAMTLTTLTLEGGTLDAFRRLMSCLSSLLGGVGSAAELATEAATLRTRLEEARYVERMWADVETMVDAGTTRGWSSPHMAEELGKLGLDTVPEHVAVGLLVGQRDTADPVDDLVLRDAFQRAAVAYVRRRGGIVAGRAGDHGIVLVQGEFGAASRQRARLLDAGARLAAVARQFGFALHLGVSASERTLPLPSHYQLALAAAERAVSQAAPVVHVEATPSRRQFLLRELRRGLSQAARENPSALSLRFDRYLEAVVAHSGYRLEATRAHLEVGFDEIAEALLDTGVLSERDFTEQQDTLEVETDEAATVKDVCAVYRRVVTDLAAAVARPREARHERSIRRAIAFIDENLAEPLTLPKLAAVAGFAPAYFSKVFARSEGVTFHRYVTRVRLERAKRMLISTSLSVERVGQLCGFRTRNHFHRAFRGAFRTTPNTFRARRG